MHLADDRARAVFDEDRALQEGGHICSRQTAAGMVPLLPLRGRAGYWRNQTAAGLVGLRGEAARQLPVSGRQGLTRGGPSTKYYFIEAIYHASWNI